MTKKLLAICLVLSGVMAHGQEPSDTNYDETKVPEYKLPDPLIDNAGKKVGKEEWIAYRRAELLRLFENSVYGKTPTKQLAVRYEVFDEDPKAIGGKATRKQVAAFFGDSKFRIDILLYIPNQPQKRVPGFVGLNFDGNHTVASDPKIKLTTRGKPNTRGAKANRWQIETIIDHGYAFATVHRDQIDPDNYRHDFGDGVHPLFYSEGQTQPNAREWGSIGAWAWGLSRILDRLASEDRVDELRIAVIGHSRLGKTALWAGAQDERFALVISNNSGCGGAALYRRCFGERIHHMIKPVGYWFCKNHFQFQKKENELPVDQHMLLALVAPRPLYVASATKDRWADPKGEFLAAKHASPVYELLGKTGLSKHPMPHPNQPIYSTIGYHLREGKHDVTKFDWEQYIQFSDQFLKRN